MQGEKVVKKTEVKEMAENKYAGTQTEKNLQEAFAGESQARNKYTYFASENWSFPTEHPLSFSASLAVNINSP